MFSKKLVYEIVAQQREAVSAIEGLLKKCSESEKTELWAILQSIGFNGNDKERTIALMSIACYNRELSNQILEQLIDEIGEDYDSNILSPTVTMIWYGKRRDKIRFIRNVFKWAKQVDNEKFIIWCFRCALTIDWQEIEKDLQEFILDKEDIYVVDALAYFIYENGKSEYRAMLKSLPEQAQKRAKSLKSNIKSRLHEHYMAT